MTPTLAEWVTYLCLLFLLSHANLILIRALRKGECLLGISFRWTGWHGAPEGFLDVSWPLTPSTSLPSRPVSCLTPHCLFVCLFLPAYLVGRQKELFPSASAATTINKRLIVYSNTHTYDNLGSKYVYFCMLIGSQANVKCVILKVNDISSNLLQFISDEPCLLKTAQFKSMQQEVPHAL